jgi:hypothetical protein
MRILSEASTSKQLSPLHAEVDDIGARIEVDCLSREMAVTRAHENGR